MNIMIDSNQEITQALVQEYLSYDSNTGILTWIKKPSKKTVIGTRAGVLKSNGYRQISFMGKNYPEHRFIWFYNYGVFPAEQLDHINQIRDDNRLSNLREVSISENARNRSRRDSRLDEVGIWWCKRRKRYIAEIRLNGKKVYQKTFIDIEQAILERKAKSIELGFHINHGSKSTISFKP